MRENQLSWDACIRLLWKKWMRYSPVNVFHSLLKTCIATARPTAKPQGNKGRFSDLNPSLPSTAEKVNTWGLCRCPGINAIILGGGMVGRAALSVLYALGANVTVMDINFGILKALPRSI